MRLRLSAVRRPPSAVRSGGRVALGAAAVAALVAAVVAVVATARAGERVEGRLDLYDDGQVTAWVPQVAVSADKGKIGVSARYTADLVSGATRVLAADLVSSATTFDDFRQGVDLSVEVHPTSSWSWSVGASGSVESDHRSVAPSIGFRADLAERTSTVSVRYTPSLSSTWANGSDVRRPSSSHRIEAGWTQILSRRATASLAAAGALDRCDEALGCEASPYRYVALSDDFKTYASVHEKNPSSRASGAVDARLSQAIVRGLAVHADGRLSADTWGVYGHAEELTVTSSLLDERLALGVAGRESASTAASFFRDRYDTGPSTVDGSRLGPGAEGVPEYRTGDAELAGVRDLDVTVRGGWTFRDVGPLLTLGVSGRATRMWLSYPELATPPRDGAWVVGGGFDATF